MILPMIGNLTILGSPVTFVQKIGSGFKDLVELPAEGFETSPLEGGKGMYRGAKSLLTNTFQGAFNTVESLTGSLGNGITLLVDDH
jgi:vacuolar protein sorting-associated protein 13A/C